MKPKSCLLVSQHNTTQIFDLQTNSHGLVRNTMLFFPQKINYCKGNFGPKKKSESSTLCPHAFSLLTTRSQSERHCWFQFPWQVVDASQQVFLEWIVCFLFLFLCWDLCIWFAGGASVSQRGTRKGVALPKLDLWPLGLLSALLEPGLSSELLFQSRKYWSLWCS